MRSVPEWPSFPETKVKITALPRWQLLRAECGRTPQRQAQTFIPEQAVQLIAISCPGPGETVKISFCPLNGPDGLYLGHAHLKAQALCSTQDSNFLHFHFSGSLSRRSPMQADFSHNQIESMLIPSQKQVGN